MNFDDLHDPQPPRPGSAALAAVSGRARQLRRRRAALTVGGAMAALAAIVVPAALVVTGGDDDGGRIVPATVPPSTQPAPTSPPTPAPTPSPTPATTVAPAPTFPEVVAIHGDGDAVFVDAAGAETLLFDGADPNDPPAEGELTVVDSVVLTPDGRTFVSECCEPVPGSYVEFGADGAPIEESLVYGHALALSPDGTRIASVGAGGKGVADLDGNVVAGPAPTESADDRQAESVLWLDDSTLAVIELRQSATDNDFWLYTVDLTSAVEGVGSSIGGEIQDAWPRFAGVADDGSILVFRSAGADFTSDRLEAYDPATLAARPGSDLVLPAPAIDAWYRDGLLTWIGADGGLHVGDVVVPGEFAWARPAG